MEIFNYLRQHISLIISILALLVSIIVPIFRYFYKTTRYEYLKLKGKTIEKILAYLTLINGIYFNEELKKEAQYELRIIAAKWRAYADTRNYFFYI